MRTAVLLDIDGTLVDTNYLHTLAWHRAFAECGRDVPAASIHRRIGIGAERLISELIGVVDQAVKQRWRRHFEELRREAQPFPGVSDLLRELRRRGATVVLASSSEEADVKDLVALLDADDAIDEVVCARDVEEAKPSPQVFDVAMRKASSGPDRAIAVGDTVWDVEAAKRAGLSCVCVLSGGIARCELEAAGAAAVFRDAAGLLAGLDRSPIGALLRA